MNKAALKTTPKQDSYVPICANTVDTCMKRSADAKASFTTIRDLIDRIAKLPASQAAQEYVLIKNLCDEYDEIGKILTEARDKLKQEVVPQAFERDNITSFNTADGFRVTSTQTVRCSIIDKFLGPQWLKDNGLADIVTETVNSSTLSATARAMLEDGKELPEDLFKTYLQPSTSVTKTKKN